MTRSCAICHRLYRGNAKSRWLFDPSGKLRGTVHTSCHVPAAWHAFETTTPLEEARRMVWNFYIERCEDVHSDEWYATFLLEHGDAVELNDKQRELLEWWTVKGPLKLGEERAEWIVEAYRARVSRYLAWRANLAEP